MTKHLSKAGKVNPGDSMLRQKWQNIKDATL